MGEPKCKPNWWPVCPYPESVFTMKRERYPEIVPDPDVRTGLSGMLGREFWNIASEAIWEAFSEANPADIGQRLWTLFQEHRDQVVISCPESCWCWGVEAYLNRQEACDE